MSDDLDTTPLDAPDTGPMSASAPRSALETTGTQDADEAKQAADEAKGKRDLYADPTFRKLQSQAAKAEAQAQRFAAQLDILQSEQRRQKMATLSAPERIAYEKTELEAELQLYKDAEQERLVAEQRATDLAKFARISGTPLDRFEDAKTLDDAFRIAEEYVEEKNRGALEEARDESAEKVWVGSGNKSTPRTRLDVQKAKALEEGDTRTYLRLIMEQDE